MKRPFWKAEVEIFAIVLLLVVTYWVVQIGARLFNSDNTINWFTGLGIFLALAAIWTSVIRRVVKEGQKYFDKWPQV